MKEIIELIVSLLVIAALVIGFRVVRRKITSPGLSGFLCMIMGVLALGAALYALFSLIIIVTP